MQNWTGRRTGQPIEDAQTTNVWSGKIRSSASASIAPGLKIKSINFQRTAVCNKITSCTKSAEDPVFSALAIDGEDGLEFISESIKRAEIRADNASGNFGRRENPAAS